MTCSRKSLTISSGHAEEIQPNLHRFPVDTVYVPRFLDQDNVVFKQTETNSATAVIRLSYLTLVSLYVRYVHCIPYRILMDNGNMKVSLSTL
jgi:hypothetical protein